MALLVAKRLGVPAVLDVWQAHMVSMAASVWRRHAASQPVGVGSAAASTRGAGGSLGTGVATSALVSAASMPSFFVPDPALAVALGRVVPARRVALVPWGVHPMEATRPDIPWAGTMPASGGVVSIAVLIEADRPRQARDALVALALWARTWLGPGMDGGTGAAGAREMLVLMDADAAERAGVSRVGDELPELRGRVSLISSLEGRRELVLHADVLLVPGMASMTARGEGVPGGTSGTPGTTRHHSLVLDAMACGMLVVATQDAGAQHLVDGQTCVLVPPGEAWGDGLARALGALLADAPRAASLRASARAYVSANRSASGQVGAWLAALRE